MANGNVKIVERGPLGMLTLRGRLRANEMKDAVRKALDCEIPSRLKIINGKGDWKVAWMSGDELLIIGPREEVGEIMSSISETLKGLHHLIVDVSDARAIYRIEGKAARDILSKGAPINLSNGGFSLGDFRRTRFGQVSVALWMADEENFDLVSFKSHSEYVVAWLETTATLEGLSTYY